MRKIFQGAHSKHMLMFMMLNDIQNLDMGKGVS